MDMQRILMPAKERLSLAEMTGDINDHVTLMAWPLKARQQISRAQLAGINMQRFSALVAENPDAKPEEIMRDHASELMTAELDADRVEYKRLVLLYGLDPKDHTFKDGETALTINEGLVDALIAHRPKMVEWLVEKIEAYQERYRLGE